MVKKWIETTEKTAWKTKSIDLCPFQEDELVITGNELHELKGFGGCFNELGWQALQRLNPSDKDEIMDALFDENQGAAFNFCRIPIGASDYALEWYSLNEVDQDFEMKEFSIERDKNCLIKYIHEAQKRNPELRFFASPWSPPTWMKTPKAYNYGRLIMEKKYLDAYALYFRKFIEAYEEQGIPIEQIHIQNEPFADQKFPSCKWSSEQFRIFIRDYLGPLFKKWNISTEIWLGTLNGPTQREINFQGVTIDLYDKYIDNILFDKEARQYISGIGYQWAGQHVIQRTHESFPELDIIQTENECGDGTNSFLYAQYVFNLIRHYLSNGASAYVYWNMVLETGGVSTWGWPQNSLVTVDPMEKKFHYNHEYYVMKHFSKYIKPNAKLMETTGHYCGASVVAKNPDGSITLVVSNALDRNRKITISLYGKKSTIELEPNSFNTLILE